MHFIIRKIGLLAAITLWAIPLRAQSLEDSVQAYVAAVRGFSSPNGTLTDLSRQNACRFSEGPSCAKEPHAPPFIGALSKELGLLIASDSSDATPSCPWSNTAGRRTGVVVEVGILRIRGETATVSIARRCRADRGFRESVTVELRRRNDVWEFVRLREHRIT